MVPVNLFLQALFSSTAVTMQNKAVMASNYNPFTAMFRTLLYIGQDATFSQLSSQHFMKHKDHPEDCEAAWANSGFFPQIKIH